MSTKKANEKTRYGQLSDRKYGNFLLNDKIQLIEI